MEITYQQLKKQLQQNYPIKKPFHYWIISSPYTYPSMTAYNNESTKVFPRDTEPDIKRFNKINFENCIVYQCDGKGGTDNNDKPLSEYIEIPEQKIKTWKVKFVFDCSRYGSIYKTITCSEENFYNAYEHELMLARIDRDLHYDEPSVMLSKEEI